MPSKASAWANARPEGCKYFGETIAQVTEAGSVRAVGWHTITGEKDQFEITAEAAIAIAHWIINTFESEAPAAPSAE